MAFLKTLGKQIEKQDLQEFTKHLFRQRQKDRKINVEMKTQASGRLQVNLNH